jgi:hypothetical protein
VESIHASPSLLGVEFSSREIGGKIEIGVKENLPFSTLRERRKEQVAQNLRAIRGDSFSSRNVPYHRSRT